MKLSQKLVGGYLLIAVITAVTGYAGLYTANRLKSSYEQLILGEFPIHKSLGQLKFAGLRIVASTAEAVLMLSPATSGDKPVETVEEGGTFVKEMRAIDVSKADFYKALGNYSATIRLYDPERERHVKVIEGLVEDLLDRSFELILTMKNGGSPGEIKEIHEGFEGAEDAYLSYIDQIIDEKETHLLELKERSVSYYNRTFAVFILLGSLVLVGAFAFGIVQARGIAGNLAGLTRKARMIGRGELDQRVEITSSDELGELAGTFNQMASDLAEIEQARSRDQEHLKQYANQLENTARELQEIVFAASHDLQEPMRKIMTFSERLTLEAQGRDLGNCREFLERIMLTAGKMRGLLDDLLNFSQLVSTEPAIKRNDLGQLVPLVADKYLRNIGQDVMDFSFGAELPELDCDGRMMEVLLTCLFDNSLKFSRPGVKPVVSIDAEEVQGGWLLTVEDNGQGFDEKFARRIFGIFERLHNDAGIPGNGMGLAVCRKIVEKHGGTIRAEAEEGKGVKMLINLPISRARTPAPV